MKIYLAGIMIPTLITHMHSSLSKLLKDNDILTSDNLLTDKNSTMNLEEKGLDLLPEIGGRICYDSYEKPRPGGNQSYMDNILASGHGSITQHSIASFIFTGVSRTFTHELIRHSAGTAFSQRSQRFCDESDNIAVKPIGLLEFEDLIDMWSEMQLQYNENYKIFASALELRIKAKYPNLDKTTSRKRIREIARSLLSGAASTEIMVTGNIRAWRNILEQRGSKYADLEFRTVVAEIERILWIIAPNCMQDFELSESEDGFPVLSNKYRKV